MRSSLGTAANGFAWAVLLGLVALAALLVGRLGFVGLLLLGLLTCLVCTLVSLDEAVPTWSVGVFRSRMSAPGSPEQRAAARAEHDASRSVLRFCRRCGIALVLAGVAGLAWQLGVPFGAGP